MPNLPTHFNFALQTLSALDDPSIEAHVGSFLLGCTTPDIRARTKWKRAHTHFAPLEVDRVGVGTEGLFESNPHLSEMAQSSGATRAFVAGYISHLVTDETWITQVFQPYFADRDLFPDPIKASVSDRAVQLDMDREAWEEAPGMDKVIEQLQRSDRGVDVGFIDTETLGQWRSWVSDFSGRPFSWDRLSFLAQRMYRDSEEAQMVVESFLSSLHTNLRGVYSRVPKKKVKEFREKAVSESTRLIKERLDVP